VALHQDVEKRLSAEAVRARQARVRHQGIQIVAQELLEVFDLVTLSE
jgi:hypothetical protein